MSTLNKEWLTVLVGLLVAIPIWFWRGHLAGAGDQLEVDITLVSSDRDDLACGLNRKISGLSCAFSDNGKELSSQIPAEQILAPYLTTSRQLFLIPHLFGQPTLAARYEAEMAKGRHRSRLKRFTVHCKLILVEKVQDVSVRWTRKDKLNRFGDGWVAQVKTCEIRD